MLTPTHIVQVNMVLPLTGQLQQTTIPVVAPLMQVDGSYVFRLAEMDGAIEYVPRERVWSARCIPISLAGDILNPAATPSPAAAPTPPTNRASRRKTTSKKGR